jgi:xylan 1,4-beta-xylosidase
MASAPGAWADDPPLRQITVDATLTVGTLRPLSGIQAPADNTDVTAFYKGAHIDLVRIAEVSGADVESIFPDMSADADNPKSYQFAAPDRLVASAKSAGAEMLFRIGRSPAAGSPTVGAGSPDDADKFAQVARHIVLHYNQGWNKGFRHAIRYWEIGTRPEEYTLYAKTARAIESADDSVLIGGPVAAKPLIAGAGRENFLGFARANRLPIDFFSWRFFAADSNDPFTFVTVARELRRVLDAQGFGSTKNILDGWNEDPADPNPSKAGRAAFAASALIYMLGGPVDAQTFYRADADLAGRNGVPDEVGHALFAFGMLKSTPVLIRTTGGDEAGFALAAGRSRDGRLLQILISNYQVAGKYLQPRDNWNTSLPERRVLQYHDNGGYDAAITLAAAGKYQVKRYRISDSSNLTAVDQSTQIGPNIHLQAALPPPGIELIVISAM